MSVRDGRDDLGMEFHDELVRRWRAGNLDIKGALHLAESRRVEANTWRRRARLALEKADARLFPRATHVLLTYEVLRLEDAALLNRAEVYAPLPASGLPTARWYARCREALNERLTAEYRNLNPEPTNNLSASLNLILLLPLYGPIPTESAAYLDFSPEEVTP